MIKKKYGHNFYKDRHQKTVHSAQTVLSIVLDSLPPVHSAIDFGCGVGTWLSVLKDKGVSEIKGLDGPWVKQNLLEIPKQDFRVTDFEKEISCEKKYDLAMTLEVAEHISSKNAERFVNSLVSASDFVLFSAAIPFQGGTGHVNEQWPEYWQELFAKKDYVVLDFIRKSIWNDKNIPIWYRQNILLFVNKNQIEKVRAKSDVHDNQFALSIVHPETYLSKMTVKGSWKLLRRALKNCIKKSI